MSDIDALREAAETHGDELALSALADALEEAGDDSLRVGLSHPMAATLIAVPHLDGIIGWGVD